MDLTGIIQIGTVVNSHGNKGELKVFPLTDEPEIFYELDRLIIIQEGRRKDLNLVRARESRNGWLLEFSEITDMDGALQHKGAGIFTEEENLRPLDEDEFFIHDLIHAKVYSTDNQFLGTIVNYFEAGPQGVCEVASETDSFLFPTSNEVLVSLIPGEKVVINLIPDLRDLNKRKSH